MNTAMPDIIPILILLATLAFGIWFTHRIGCNEGAFQKKEVDK